MIKKVESLNDYTEFVYSDFYSAGQAGNYYTTWLEIIK